MRLTRQIAAPRARVYRALLDAEAVRRWMELGWNMSLDKLTRLVQDG